MLLICPVRPGDSNDELRYAMRSWETNLHPDSGLELWTVGYKPSWLEPNRHIDGNRFASMPANVFDNIRMASDYAVGHTDHVLYMNDDFFCLDPMSTVLPVKRNITLEQHCAKFPENASTWWPTSLRLTASWLAEQGFPQPDSFEVHRPLLARPEGMSDALSRWDGGMDGPIPQWRTVYGTLSKVDAYPVQDVKIGPRNTGYGSPWISTSDQTWRIHALTMRARFQKPSRWERQA